MYISIRRAVWPVALFISVLAQNGVLDKGQEVCQSRMIWKNFVQDLNTCSMTDHPLKKNESKPFVKKPSVKSKTIPKKSSLKGEDRLKYMQKLFRCVNFHRLFS